ncbi:MAG TPA: hypothetical protein VNF47_21360 [Streptosporangiaceae bacterium]|nr:hypothetical protein [Streptosporangiaceae bacterium]
MKTPAPRQDGGVRVTRAAMEELWKITNPAQGGTLRRLIVGIPQAEGIPVDISGAPPGTQYLAIVSDDPELPVIVYRPTLPDEEGEWLVTALLDRDTYQQQKQAEKRGLLQNDTVRAGIQAAAMAAAAIAIGMLIGRDISAGAPKK